MQRIRSDIRPDAVKVDRKVFRERPPLVVALERLWHSLKGLVFGNVVTDAKIRHESIAKTNTRRANTRPTQKRLKCCPQNDAGLELMDWVRRIIRSNLEPSGGSGVLPARQSSRGGSNKTKCPRGKGRLYLFRIEVQIPIRAMCLAESCK
jgi:hypothetical protein